MNICKKCKHSVKNGFWECKRGCSETINRVTGDRQWIGSQNCITARNEDGDCGPEGKYFESIPEMTAWDWIKCVWRFVFRSEEK